METTSSIAQLDPVRFEVIRSALVEVTEEMGASLAGVLTRLTLRRGPTFRARFSTLTCNFWRRTSDSRAILDPWCCSSQRRFAATASRTCGQAMLFAPTRRIHVACTSTTSP